MTPQTEHRTRGEAAAKTITYLPCARQFIVKTSVTSFMFKSCGSYSRQQAAHLAAGNNRLALPPGHRQPCLKLQVKW